MNEGGGGSIFVFVGDYRDYRAPTLRAWEHDSHDSVCCTDNLPALKDHQRKPPTPATTRAVVSHPKTQRIAPRFLRTMAAPNSASVPIVQSITPKQGNPWQHLS